MSEQIIPEESRGKNKASNLRGIRTLQTDLQEYGARGIPVEEIAREGEKRGGLRFVEKTLASSYKNKKTIFISAAVLVIGTISLGVWLINKGKEEKNFLTPTSATPIISAEETVEILVDLTNPSQSLRDIKEALRSPTNVNRLLYISLTKRTEEIKQPLTREEFFKIVNLSPPPELGEFLTGQFMLAKIYLTKDWPILILGVRSYGATFSGMIKWEELMVESLRELFSLEAKTIDGLNDPFEDREIQNHDVRILKDKNGAPLLAYAFINQKYIAISKDIEPLKELFRRFSSAQYLNK
jgi:hypothetical protein